MKDTQKEVGMDKIIRKKKYLYLVITLMVLLLSYLVVVAPHKNIQEPKAKVLTSLGCFQTDNTAQEIEDRNTVFGKPLGFKLEVCE